MTIVIKRELAVILLISDKRKLSEKIIIIAKE